MLIRALTRAEIPVRYSQGFNPHAKVSLPLPRPVGVASDVERLLVELTESVSPDELTHRLAEQMPTGVTMRQARMLEAGELSIPRLVRYSVDTAGFDSDQLASRAKQLLQFEPIHYDRFVHSANQTRRIDLRPYLDTIEVAGDHAFFSIHVTGGGSVKPSEVCDVMGMGSEHTTHLIRRLEVTWQSTRM